jgi:argininosuccinate lyase
MKMWSGRFRQPLDKDFERWQRSFPFDRILLPHELAASRAHARALGLAGILSRGELDAILNGLGKSERTPRSSPLSRRRRSRDVHHFVENSSPR